MRSSSILVAAVLGFAALSAQAQTSAISYPSVARVAPDAPNTSTPPIVQGERVRIERVRVVTEPVFSAFVYERLGATPRVHPRERNELAAVPAAAVASTR
jgi:hypothetical protein